MSLDLTEDPITHLANIREALLEAVGMDSPIGTFWLGHTVMSPGEVSGFAITIGSYIKDLEAALGPERAHTIHQRFTSAHIIQLLHGPSTTSPIKTVTSRRIPYLQHLSEYTNSLLKTHQRTLKAHCPHSHIDWEELTCVAAQHIVESNGEEFDQVVIQEVSPSDNAFHLALKAVLRQHGYGSVRIHGQL